jgi:hypothetical protein
MTELDPGSMLSCCGGIQAVAFADLCMLADEDQRHWNRALLVLKITKVAISEG